MPRKKRVPAYRLHKSSGQARVIIDGRHYYLGPFGSPASREAYARLIAEKFSNSLPKAGPSIYEGDFPDLTINELLVAYLEFAEKYYVRAGQISKEYTCMKEALGPLQRLYGALPAKEFGPRKLKVVRQSMVERGLSRGVVNRRTNRIKRMIKWAVGEELLLPSVYEGVRAVSGLQFGRTEARETDPIKPVPDNHVAAVLPFASHQVAVMIQVQRFTGMRPGELVIMRPVDIDRESSVWLYEPSQHKNQWRGHRRVIPLGPRSQELLLPFLDRSEEAYLFSPAEAERSRNHVRRQTGSSNRSTPVYPSELRARERRHIAAKTRISRRAKREYYTVDSYRRSIDYAIAKANRYGGLNEQLIPHWHPNQLRHSFATDVRKAHGVEAAQVGLGQARTNIVDIYAEKNLTLAIEIARQNG